MKGIGVDLVEISRFARSTKQFAHLILTNSEFDEFYKRDNDIEYLASRFAAKEATVKAIGHKMSFQSIQITNNEEGKPQLEILTTGLYIRNAFVSITHEKNYVVAMVVLE